MSNISPSGQSGWAGALLSALADEATSTGTVVSWLRGNLGHLNSILALGTGEYTLSGDYITPEMTQMQSGIYNELYFCYFLKREAMRNVGALSYDWKEMVGDDQGSVKVVTRTEKAKVYQSLAKDCDARIKELVKTYRGGTFAGPLQILYNSRNSSSMTGLNLPFSSINPIISG